MSNKENLLTSKKKNKIPWTREEDELLKNLVNINGPKKWTVIAKELPYREGKQCRERWHNHINPYISKNRWSDYEEWLLFLLHKIHGNKWARISSYLSNRTDNTIKNHWNSIMKKKISYFNERLEHNIQNKENIMKDQLIYSLIVKLEKGEIDKTTSRKGRKTKEEYNDIQMLKSNNTNNFNSYHKNNFNCGADNHNIFNLLNYNNSNIKSTNTVINESNFCTPIKITNSSIKKVKINNDSMFTHDLLTPKFSNNNDNNYFNNYFINNDSVDNSNNKDLNIFYNNSSYKITETDHFYNNYNDNIYNEICFKLFR